MEKYSLITLGWKSWENIEYIIQSAYTATIKPTEIIIVVNKYADFNANSIEFTINTYKQGWKGEKILLKTAYLSHNIGVGPAWNLAVCMASNDNVIIINDDCQVENNIYEKMVSKLNEHRHNGMVGVEWGGKPEEDVYPTPKGFLMGFKKQMLYDIGMFREQYAPFADERELGLRALVRGWKCAIAEGCSYHHICDFSNNPTNPIPFLENIINPRELQLKLEPIQQALIDEYNFNLIAWRNM
jgi:hypothetical protein